MVKFYGIAKKPSIGRGTLYLLGSGQYTYMKTDGAIEATTSRKEAQFAAKNLSEKTGQHHFAAIIATTS